MNIFACIIPDSAVLTLREETPSADSCGGPFLEMQIEGLLAVRCGSSWDKEKIPYGSGDEYDDMDYTWPVTTVETTVMPSRTLLTTTFHRLITQSTKSIGMGIISITPNKSPSRLPPSLRHRTDGRESSFQNLLRIHLNTFNQRLSMLEGNTLDMKESIRSMEALQRSLGSTLKELVTTQSNRVKSKTVSELEKSYTDVDARLTRLEDRLEILIDGFTLLAQELNKMKHTRQTFCSPEKKKVLPSLATVIAVPSHSTSQPPVRILPTQPALLSNATVPKSIPTPRLPANRPITSSQRIRKVKPAATSKQEDHTTQFSSVPRSESQVSTSAARKVKTTLSKPSTVSKTKPKTTVKPKTKRPGGWKPTETDNHVTQPSQTRPKQVKKETAITTFLKPSFHKSKAARTPQLHKQSDKAKKKDSALPIKNNGHSKTFSFNVPVTEKGGEGVTSLQGKKKNNKKINEKKVPVKDKISSTTTKASTPKKSKTTIKTPAKTKAATTAKKISKKTQKKKKTNPHSDVLDLLRILKGDLSPTKKKNQDSSLHIVLGRLAIPIKIIPDD